MEKVSLFSFFYNLSKIVVIFDRQNSLKLKNVKNNFQKDIELICKTKG